MTPPLPAHVQQLEAENARLKADVLRLAERVAVCSEILSRVAERERLSDNETWQQFREEAE